MGLMDIEYNCNIDKTNNDYIDFITNRFNDTLPCYNTFN